MHTPTITAFKDFSELLEFLHQMPKYVYQSDKLMRVSGIHMSIKIYSNPDCFSQIACQDMKDVKDIHVESLRVAAVQTIAEEDAGVRSPRSP
jgi:hypothetical protein